VFTSLRVLSVALFTLVLTACGAGGPGTDQDDPAYDQTKLAQFRSALPTADQLLARSPEATGSRAIGDPAFYPGAAYHVVMGINGSVGWIIEVLRRVTEHPPTVFNSETSEFVWGPWPNEDDFGTIAVYIREEAPEADFQYTYAFIRGAGQDLATMTPVIWGATNPDPHNEDFGMGITLFDQEANRGFAQVHDPDFGSKDFGTGRFVTLYGAGADENQAGASHRFVVAVFRNFIGQDQAAESPAPTNLDYFYGHWQGPAGNTLDFVDFAFEADVDDNGVDDLPETLGINLVFLNGARGRAEAEATGGDLTETQRVDATECWDDAVARQYLAFELTDDGISQQAHSEGDPVLCLAPFDQPLANLGLPKFEDLDPNIIGAMQDVAQNGLPQE